MKKVILSIGLVAVFSTILSACLPQTPPVQPESNAGNENVVADPSFPVDQAGESNIQTETPSENVQNTTAQYIAYSPEKIAESASRGPVVLFFHASWCPTCKVANADIVDNLSQLPANLTILKVDYDNSSDLKKKYAVTYQHTFVQVDAQGNEITKWNGGGVAELHQNIQQ